MMSTVLDRGGAPDALAGPPNSEGSASGNMSGGPSSGGLPSGGPGRTRIAAKALEHVAVAIAAETLGVPAGRVTVSLADDRGALALVVTSPMRVPPLGLIAAAPDAVARSGGSILDRAGEATGAIGAKLEALSGSRVTRVVVRVSGIESARRGRVS
ncbi:hypothetical protein [Plantibacter sp. YIM 135347]|uniref:hypothetical protein n=1 Tax=Plantibacter sp. YIM 135347 TaxID=3423919 RepID=UPI003D333AE3